MVGRTGSTDSVPMSLRGGLGRRSNLSIVPASGPVIPNLIREPGFLDPGFRRIEAEPAQLIQIFQDLALAFIYSDLWDQWFPNPDRKSSMVKSAGLLWILLVIALIGAKTNWVEFRVLVRTSSVHNQ